MVTIKENIHLNNVWNHRKEEVVGLVLGSQ
jgi:hypothetical protein